MNTNTLLKNSFSNPGHVKRIKSFERKKVASRGRPDDMEARKRELLKVMGQAYKNIISYSFVERIRDSLHLPDTFLSSLLVTSILAVFTWIISWLVDRITNIPLSWFEAIYLAIPAIATGIFILVTKVATDICFVANFDYIADFCKEKNGIVAMTNWFKRTFVICPQVVFSLVIGLIGIISLWVLLVNYPMVRGLIGVYVGTFACMAVIGVGTYLALTIPTVVSLGSKYEMNVYPFDPAKSRVVQATSNMFGELTLGVSVIATTVMILIFILNPWGNTTKWIALAWLVFVWGVTTYTFLLPHYFLRKTIIYSKFLVLQELDLIINDYQSRIKSLKLEEWGAFKEVIFLREKVSITKNSPIQLHGWSQYFTSLVIPTLSYVVGLIDIKSIIPNIFA